MIPEAKNQLDLFRMSGVVTNSILRSEDDRGEKEERLVWYYNVFSEMLDALQRSFESVLKADDNDIWLAQEFVTFTFGRQNFLTDEVKAKVKRLSVTGTAWEAVERLEHKVEGLEALRL